MAKGCGTLLAAKLNKRITIQEVIQVGDGQGGYVETWGTVATMWAEIEPIKAYERFQAAQLETPITHKVTMRYRAGINTKQRFLYDSRIFHIEQVINQNEANSWLVLRAKEMEGTNA